MEFLQQQTLAFSAYKDLASLMHVITADTKLLSARSFPTKSHECQWFLFGGNLSNSARDKHILNLSAAFPREKNCKESHFVLSRPDAMAMAWPDAFRIADHLEAALSSGRSSGLSSVK